MAAAPPNHHRVPVGRPAGGDQTQEAEPQRKERWRFQPLRKALISSRRRQRGRQASVEEDVADRDGLLTAEGAFRRGG